MPLELGWMVTKSSKLSSIIPKKQKFIKIALEIDIIYIYFPFFRTNKKHDFPFHQNKRKTKMIFQFFTIFLYSFYKTYI